MQTGTVHLGLARKWLALTLLCGCGPALAQAGGEGVPDAAQCAALVAPVARAFPPLLETAVQTTTQAYLLQRKRLIGPLANRPPTDAERRELGRLGGEVDAYLGRLLSRYGWPADPLLRASLGQVLSDASLKFCAGQVALAAATTLEERSGAASLIDQGLIGLGEDQRYGTVARVTGRTLTPWPIQDAPGVDARRAALGLLPLAEVLAQEQAVLPGRVSPPGLKRPVELRPVCQDFTTRVALNTPLTAERIDRLDDEAAQLVEQDQASRLGQSGARDMRVVDAESTAWLKEVLSRSGWPSTNRAGSQLASNAWLLTQHADANAALQACVLDLIRHQKTTQQEDQNFAYLTDRVRLAQNQPQVYGTQVSYDDVWRKASPRMLEDPEGVNERRAKIGLESIEEYLKRFEPKLK